MCYYNFTQGITTILIYVSTFPSLLKIIFNLGKIDLESAFKNT